MSVQQDLLDLGDLFNFCDLSTFTQNIPIEWVASALDLSSQATIRRRRLPADQVLWLVLGMALFREEPVHEVARRLNICAQGLASDDGGSECDDAEKEYFDIIVKKKGKIKWSETATERLKQQNSCPTADRGKTTEINDKFGKARG